MFSLYKGLPRSIYVLFIVQIINRMGDFVLPFFTFYLTQKLGMPPEETGFYVMLAPLTFIPGNFFGGYLADYIGRKKAYMLMQSLAALFLIPCAFLQIGMINVYLILAATFCGSAVRPAITTMISDALPASERQRGFSLTYLGINIGVSIGPLIAGFLFHRALWLFFLGDAITSIAAVILVMLTIPNARASYDEKHLLHTEKVETRGVLRALLDRPIFLGIVLIGTLYTIAYTQINFLLPLTLSGLFMDKGAEYYGLIISVNAVTVVAMTLPLTHMTKNFRPMWAIVLTGFLYCVGFGMIPLLRTLLGFCLSTYIWTLGEILISMFSGVLTANYSPINLRGRFNSVSSLAWSVGGAVGTLIAGKLFGIIGGARLWYGVSGLAFIGALLAIILMKIEIKRESRNM